MGCTRTLNQMGAGVALPGLLGLWLRLRLRSRLWMALGGNDGVGSSHCRKISPLLLRPNLMKSTFRLRRLFARRRCTVGAAGSWGVKAGSGTAPRPQNPWELIYQLALWGLEKSLVIRSEAVSSLSSSSGPATSTGLPCLMRARPSSSSPSDMYCTICRLRS